MYKNIYIVLNLWIVIMNFLLTFLKDIDSCFQNHFKGTEKLFLNAFSIVMCFS